MTAAANNPGPVGGSTSARSDGSLVATGAPSSGSSAGVLAASALGLALLLVIALVGADAAGILGDLEIYRGAISHALSGGRLYEWVYAHPTVHGLGFTYPPFAAILLAPMVLMDELVAKVLWTAFSFMALAATLLFLVDRSAACRGREGADNPRHCRLLWLAGLSIPVMLSDPFMHNLVVGQISVFIVALSVLDVALPKRWQGAMVGLAAAIKLTPLVFVPYFIVTRQWRQAAVSGGVFAGATAIAFVVMPQASFDYWFETLWQTGRVGRTESTVNKSLLGLLARWLPEEFPTTIAWIVLAVLVTVIALWRAAQQLRDGYPIAATLIIGVLSVAISPISWPHHQLWLVLAACWCILAKGRAAVLLGITTLVVMATYPWFADYPAASVGPWLRLGIELPVVASLVLLASGLLPARSGALRAWGGSGLAVRARSHNRLPETLRQSAEAKPIESLASDFNSAPPK